MAPAVYAAARRWRAGQIERDARWWNRVLGLDGAPDRFAAGRYRLRADGNEVECKSTDQDADLEISQQALASMYLGGFRLRELLLSGVARGRTPGALALIDLMFSSPLAPWNATWF